MKQPFDKFVSSVRCSLLLSFFFLLSARAADLWSTAYYAAWLQGAMPASNVDYSAVTHVIHFALEPNPDGSLNVSRSHITPDFSRDLVSHAHAAKRKVLISLGGANTQKRFQAATTSTNLPVLVNQLHDFISTYDYDGIDLDWEPLSDSDIPKFTNLVVQLRSMLDKFPRPKLLTAATAWQPALFASIQDKFDQINLMTYDFSGPWHGWVTWFNSPLYDGGCRFPENGQLIPSADGMVKLFLTNGVRPAKLGIGIPFYGTVWSGGSGTPTGGASLPRQSWSTPPKVRSYRYDYIMTNFNKPEIYHWDTNAQCSYLSIDASGSENDKFISFDDERSCATKVQYAREHKLGGIMIFDLGNGYCPTQPPGQRDPLLQSVKKALVPR
jgi:chitinase